MPERLCLSSGALQSSRSVSIAPKSVQPDLSQSETLVPRVAESSVYQKPPSGTKSGRFPGFPLRT
jgi:hypothetical protein